jgi:uncharacterized membrane-anchored protein
MLANISVRWWCVAIVLLALLLINISIFDKQTLLQQGDRVILQMEPADPRSLMQGDYLALNYTLSAPLLDAWQKKCNQQPSEGCFARSGRVVVTLDAQRVAVSVRLDDGSPLKTDEHYLRYRYSINNRLQFATDAYFFPEGQQMRFSKAKYGQLRVDDEGNALLDVLLDNERKAILP